MKVRALKTTHLLARGKTGEIPDYEANELIALGYVVEELPVEKLVAAPQNIKLEESNDNDPFEEPRTGFQTGEGKQPSLSRGGHPQRKRRSTSRGGDAK